MKKGRSLGPLKPDSKRQGARVENESYSFFLKIPARVSHFSVVERERERERNGEPAGPEAMEGGVREVVEIVVQDLQIPH